jgi:hypothetical protein
MSQRRDPRPHERRESGHAEPERAAEHPDLEPDARGRRGGQGLDRTDAGTQLRLVASPGTKQAARPARPAKLPRSRRAHWAADWRLDADTRRVGRAGVEAARAALERAREPVSQLPRAS